LKSNRLGIWKNEPRVKMKRNKILGKMSQISHNSTTYEYILNLTRGQGEKANVDATTTSWGKGQWGERDFNIFSFGIKT